MDMKFQAIDPAVKYRTVVTFFAPDLTAAQAYCEKQGLILTSGSMNLETAKN